VNNAPKSFCDIGKIDQAAVEAVRLAVQAVAGAHAADQVAVIAFLAARYGYGLHPFGERDLLLEPNRG
jgi:hypothetical protein